MKRKHSKPLNDVAKFKGELVPDKDTADNQPTGKYLKENPYKTPPNNLTTK